MAGSRRHTRDECSRDPSIGRPRRLDGRTHRDAVRAAVCSDPRGSKPFARTFVPQLGSSRWPLQLPPERSWRAVLQQLGSSKLVLLIAKLLGVADRDAGLISQMADSLLLDELRPRSSISPSRRRASNLCALSARRDARVTRRSRGIACKFGCVHIYIKGIFGAPDAGCARLQLAPLHAVTDQPVHYC